MKGKVMLYVFFLFSIFLVPFVSKFWSYLQIYVDRYNG